jgi:hypothetical protein
VSKVTLNGPCIGIEDFVVLCGRTNVRLCSFRLTHCQYTRRKPCPMQPDKERLHVLCNSKTTTKAIFCINIDMHRLVVVFQSLGRLRDNCKCPKRLQMS